MISLAFKKVLFKFVFCILNCPRIKENYLIIFFFFKKRLRLSYTIPKNKYPPVSNNFFIKNYKDLRIIKNSFIKKILKIRSVVFMIIFYMLNKVSKYFFITSFHLIMELENQ